jgi:hypothetical protein
MRQASALRRALGEEDFHPAVLRAAGFGAVVGHRVARAAAVEG